MVRLLVLLAEPEQPDVPAGRVHATRGAAGKVLHARRKHGDTNVHNRWHRNFCVHAKKLLLSDEMLKITNFKD